MDAADSDLRIDREDDGSRPLRMWSVWFDVVGAVVIFCYLWIDRRLAFRLYTHQHQFPDTDDLNALARIPNPLIILSTILFLVLGFMFFFSSRRRHTRWTGDWSSDVCSSDLGPSSPCRARPSRPPRRHAPRRPTRRSRRSRPRRGGGRTRSARGPPRLRRPRAERLDRKSTRLNSSHPSISYAVFCLKKKT